MAEFAGDKPPFRSIAPPSDAIIWACVQPARAHDLPNLTFDLAFVVYQLPKPEKDR